MATHRARLAPVHVAPSYRDGAENRSTTTVSHAEAPETNVASAWQAGGSPERDEFGAARTKQLTVSGKLSDPELTVLATAVIRGAEGIGVGVVLTS